MPSGKGLLTSIQRQFPVIFAELPDQNQFYLTGGTCPAEFYLGHRLSLDLGFFTSGANLILPFSYQVQAICPDHSFRVSVTRRFSTFVEFLLTRDDATLRLDLALDYPFRFEPPVLSGHGVWVNDYQDLKTDKLLACYSRAEPRDAVDLYFILQQEPVASLLARAAQKDLGFDLYWFAVALSRAAELPDELGRWPVKMIIV